MDLYLFAVIYIEGMGLPWAALVLAHRQSAYG